MTLTANNPAGSDWEVYSDHRTPGISIKQLLQRGGDGTSLEFNLTRFSGEEFYAPRHHHNFDQIRIGVEGSTRYGPHEKLPARVIGYFPEGTWYGPTTVNEPTVQAILQFDGPSRLGYIDYRLHDAATAELKDLGDFRGGFYYPADGSPRIDGYQAAWERATGQPMRYPAARFLHPVYMAVDAFAWLDTDTPGVRTKSLGSFGERQTAIEMRLLTPAANHVVGHAGRRVVGFVLSGNATVGDAHCGTWSAFVTEPGETAAIVNDHDGETELVLVTFPDFSATPAPALVAPGDPEGTTGA